MLLKIKAFAKINIGLEVLGKRADGYHEINTVFAPLCLCDEISAEKSNEIKVVCKPSLGIPMSENLVYKAALALKIFYDVPQGAAIYIEKRISAGGGLGGGSSDAASALLLLSKLWHLPENPVALITIASDLGSDVPFFLKKGFALGRGRGEILEYFDLSLPFWTLIVMPGLSISTKEAYFSLNRDETMTEPSDLKEILSASVHDASLLKNNIRNDFEESAFKKFPELKEIKETLYNCGAAFALMSGSGSALYGFFTNEYQAQFSIKQLNKYRLHLCPPDGIKFQ